MQRVKSFIQEKLKEVRKNYNTARTAAGYPHYINNADWIKLSQSLNNPNNKIKALHNNLSKKIEVFSGEKLR